MRYDLSDYIETRLSDGVSSLALNEGDTLVIAGMGGPLMEKILDRGEDVLGSFQEFVLEPQSELRHFRLFLTTHGYGIISENMVLDGGKFYPVIKAVHKETEPLKPEELEYGPCLLRDQNPVLYEYLCREKESTRKLISLLSKSHSATALTRRRELEQKMNLIDIANSYYDYG
jgi:tRNA (adenine22-N1)-methyltransferase